MGLLALVRQALRVLGPLVRLVGVRLAGERRLPELQNKIEQKLEYTSLAKSEFVDFNYFSLNSKRLHCTTSSTSPKIVVFQSR